MQRGLDDARSKARNRRDMLEERMDARDVEPLGELEHAVDDHGVRLVLHVQPGGVFTAEHVVRHGSSLVRELADS